MNKLFFLTTLLFVGCMTMPQPALTEKEQNYFDVLASKYNCTIRREVNVAAKKGKRHNEKDVLAIGRYGIALNNLPCEMLNHQDSLEKISVLIAKKIFNDILDSNFAYTYEYIEVFFLCERIKNSSKLKAFKYTKAQLSFL